MAANAPAGAARWHRWLGVALRLRRAIERFGGNALPLAPLWLRAECRGPGGDPVAGIRWDPDARLSAGAPGRSALQVTPGSELCFELTIPPDGWFVAEVGVAAEESSRAGAGVAFSVAVETERQGGALAERRLVPHARWQDRGWRSLSADLSPWARQSVRLVLRTAAMPGAPGAPIRALWGEPRLLERPAWPLLVTRLWRVVRLRGWRGTIRALTDLCRGRVPGSDPQPLYQLWLRGQTLTDGRRQQWVAAVEAWGAAAPRISVAVPVFEPTRDALERCLASVRAQVYPHWELCLYDDGSPSPHVRECLAMAAAQDARIRVRHGASNAGIAEASNQALAMATAPWVAWLDHDDELPAEALAEVADWLRTHPATDVLYTDEDKLEPDGRRSSPHFKPDWSPELLRSGMYACHLAVYRRTLLDALGGLRPAFDGAQDYDLLLRAAESGARIGHLPRVLYHWRKSARSTAGTSAAKPEASDAGRRALEAHLGRVGLGGRVEGTAIPGVYRGRPAVPPDLHVTVVIPTRDQPRLLRTCLDSLRARTDHPSWSAILVDNGTRDPEALAVLRDSGHPVVRDDRPFNFSRLVNAGVGASRGPFVCLVNNDTEFRDPGWLTAMLEAAADPAVGAVGAKLLYPDGRIQHAGVILCGNEIGKHLGRLLSPLAYGPNGALLAIRNLSAVTGACMLIRRAAFDAVGGFDESLAVAYNDVDFCLRLGAAGYRVAFTPYAEVIHHESASRDPGASPEAVGFMQRRWGMQLARDPHYNVNCSLDRADWSVNV